MRGGMRGLILLVCVCMIFSSGCTKKKVAPIGGEVSPPPPITSITPPRAASPRVDVLPQPLDMPHGDSIGNGASAGLEEEAKALELNDVYFSFNQFALNPEGRKVCSQKASFLKVHPDITIRIEGHCDERGTIEYNLALGERRASEVKKYLTFLGIHENRIITISYGKEKPQALGHNEEAWAKNRRAHITLAGR